MWKVEFLTPIGSSVTDGHVYPLNDLVGHELTRQCWCKPSVGNCINGIVQVVHNAADGRELIEAAAKAKKGNT